MDDFLLFADSKKQLRNWLERLRDFLTTQLLLELKEEALRLLPVSEGIPFLGFHIFPGLIRLQHRQKIRFRRHIREREQAFRRGEIDEDTLAASVNSTIAHIAHADSYRMRKHLFWDAPNFELLTLNFQL